MGCDTYLIREQISLLATKNLYLEETIFWDGSGSKIADYLTDCELRHCVEPSELLGEVQGLLSREKPDSDNDWNMEQLSLLSEVLTTFQDDSESKYELQLS